MPVVELSKLAEHQKLYREKNARLEQFLEPVEPMEFYRELFPPGSFERKGEYEDRKPNGIALSVPANGVGVAMEIQRGGQARKYVVTDDLAVLEELQDTDFSIVAPVSYFGKHRSGKNARYLYALTFDLDGVGMPQLRDVMHQMNKDILPKATFIVNSGTGLHLYYVLTEPVPMYPHNQHYLKELKFALTRQIWNRYTSTIKQPQMQGIMQGFRVIGSGTKLGRDYPVAAFRFGDRVELDDLLDYIPTTSEEWKRLQGVMKKGKLSLEEAKERFPEWYQRRIVEGKPRGRWVVKRDLYDWWLGRIRREIKVGHRYHGVMTLAVYAMKCGIAEEELRRDAYSLLAPYDAISEDELNPFTVDDVESALAMYNESYVTFPRDDIARLSGLAMPVNRRNWRKQAVHLLRARTLQQVDYPNGEWRNKAGQPSKRDLVAAFMRAHPEVTKKTEIARALGIDRNTVAKYYDGILAELGEGAEQ